MKFAICLALFAALAIVYVSAEGGQSACRDPIEVGKTYPHHNNPTHYWFCEELNVAAVERACPEGTAYMHLLRECIPWPNWIWKQPMNPPTLA